MVSGVGRVCTNWPRFIADLKDRQRPELELPEQPGRHDWVYDAVARGENSSGRYFISYLRCNICSIHQPGVVEGIASLAEGQWGMFTTAQAETRGVPRTDVARLVRRQLARRLRHGVHMMPGVPSSPFEEIRAEWLATDPARTAAERRDDPEPVIVSDESAALILGIGDLPPGGVHLTSVRRLQSRQQWVTIHRRQITDREYEWVDGLPVTTPRRTLEDLADSGRWEQSHLRALANDAIDRGLLPASDLAASYNTGFSLIRRERRERRLSVRRASEIPRVGSRRC